MPFLTKIKQIFRRKKKEKIKEFPRIKEVYKTSAQPIKQRVKKPSPIQKNKVKKFDDVVNIKVFQKNLKIKIPSSTDLNSPERDSPEYTKYEIGYDYNKDRTYQHKLTNQYIIEKLFEDVDLSKPTILRGSWENNENLKEGWMVPCYFCWTLTMRKIGYQNKHIIYACQNCLSAENITRILSDSEKLILESEEFSA